MGRKVGCLQDNPNPSPPLPPNVFTAWEGKWPQACTGKQQYKDLDLEAEPQSQLLLYFS